MDEKPVTDAQWLKQQRLEADRRAWLWARLKSLAGWIGGTLTAGWATVDVVSKIVDWWRKL